MKIIISLLLIALLFGTQQVFAHSDHAHGPISEAAAMPLAAEVTAELSSRDAGLGFGQLPESWVSIPKENVAIYKKGKGYYIVSVLNEGEKKTLFVLMSDSGEVYDANFSGAFNGIK